MIDEATRWERLTQLRRVVVEAAPDRFDMRSFSADTPCGTAYCAAGWAAIDPWFREHTHINESVSYTHLMLPTICSV